MAALISKGIAAKIAISIPIKWVIALPGSLTLKTKHDLEAVNNDTWKEFEKAFDVVANNEFIVYLKLTDNSGNIEFISTNGLIELIGALILVPALYMATEKYFKSKR